MVILDTNIWYAYLSEDDYLHVRAENVFETMDDDILIPEYVLSELCSLLARKKRKDSADRFIELAESNEHVELLPSSPQFFSEVRSRFQSIQSSRLSFVDVALIVLSHSIRVYTFDATLYKHLKSRTAKAP